MRRIANTIRDFFKKKEPKFNLRTEHKVKLAFELDGIKYFEFDDANNIPCGRSFSALSFYEELSMRCTREFLIAHCKATQDIINSKKIDLYQIAKLNMQLQERLDLIVEPEILYKLASVVYFDESENPYSYDFKYGQEKIIKWKKNKLEDFFLSLPIKKLIPHLSLSDEDLVSSLKITELMNKEHLKSIFTASSPENQKNELFKSAELQT